MGKRLGALLAVLLLSSTMVAGTQRASAGNPVGTLPALPADVRAALVQAVANHSATLDMQLLLAQGQSVAQGRRQLAKMGAQVIDSQGAWLAVRVPVARVAELPRQLALAGAEVAGTVQLEAADVVHYVDQAQAADEIHHAENITGAIDFRNMTGATGAGETIAVIDTGVDPGHPALQSTAAGTPKLVDWHDFTQDGRVQTVPIPDTGAADIATPMGLAHVGDIRSASGNYRFGRLSENGELDLNHNGSLVDSFGVLLVDSKTPGVYDTVYVDPFGLGAPDFTSAMPLTRFAAGGAVGHVGPNLVAGPVEHKTNFVVSDLDPAGSYVQFGFDTSGHGTHVAAIAAGNVAGGYAGFAPGARVMALKVVDHNGRGRMADVERALLYAVQHGANIINLSLSAESVIGYGTTLGALLDRVVRDQNVLVVTAAGNRGPGISSVAPPATASNVISVGAYYDPELMAAGLGYKPPFEGLLPFSGMGPSTTGGGAPDLVAPGILPAAVPGFLSHDGFGWMEGTSQATPAVAGAAALLLDAARDYQRPMDSQSIERALVMGGRTIVDYQSIEQGHGLLSMLAAWQHLSHINTRPQLDALGPLGGLGLLGRNTVPGYQELTVSNHGSSPVLVNLFTNQPWVHLQQQSLMLPPGIPRSLGLDFDQPAQPGLYTASVVVHNPNAYGDDLTLPVTVIKPHRFPDSGSLHESSSVRMGRIYRYFFLVPDGAAKLHLNVAVPVGNGQLPRGQLQAVLTRPDGQVGYRSGRLGVGADHLFIDTNLSDPMGGTWELAVFAPLDASQPEPIEAIPLSFQLDIAQMTWPTWQLNLSPGGRQAASLEVTNGLQDMKGHVVVYGPDNLADAPYSMLDQVGVIDLFTLMHQTSAVRIHAQLAQAGDLQIYLYRNNPLSPEPELVAASVPDSAGGQVVQATDLPEGDYFVFVEAPGASGSVLYQYRRQMTMGQETPISGDPVTSRPVGSSWTVPLTVVAPQQPGRYFLQAALVSDSGQMLAWHTLPISVGLPGVQVEAMDSSLVQGTPGQVTLNVRDTNGQALSGQIEVNGVQYALKDGHTHVAVQPGNGTNLLLRVHVDLAQHAELRTALTLPVYADFTGIPAGPVQGQEHGDWRRKLMNELSQWGQSP